MTTVFVGGSRHLTRIPPSAAERLGNIMAEGHDVVVGDANGADKAVQAHLHAASYPRVTVFCSAEPRNNLGSWPTRRVIPPPRARGSALHAVKDREMARQADVGFML